MSLLFPHAMSHKPASPTQEALGYGLLDFDQEHTLCSDTLRVNQSQEAVSLLQAIESNASPSNQRVKSVSFVFDFEPEVDC
jgi:hypothetical protein